MNKLLFADNGDKVTKFGLYLNKVVKRPKIPDVPVQGSWPVTEDERHAC
jgi:hypothetical protein